MRFTSRSGGFPKIFRRAASSAAFVPACAPPSTRAASSSRPSVRAGAGAPYETVRECPIRVVGSKPRPDPNASSRPRPLPGSCASACRRLSTFSKPSLVAGNARSSAARARPRAVSASASLSAPSAPLSVARNAAPSMESVRVTSRAVWDRPARHVAPPARVRRRRRPREVSESSNVLTTDDARVRDGATALDHAQARPVPTLTRDGLSRRAPEIRVSAWPRVAGVAAGRSERMGTARSEGERRATTHQRRRHRVVRTRGQRPRHQTTVGFGGCRRRRRIQPGRRRRRRGLSGRRAPRQLRHDDGVSEDVSARERRDESRTLAKITARGDARSSSHAATDPPRRAPPPRRCSGTPATGRFERRARRRLEDDDDARGCVRCASATRARTPNRRGVDSRECVGSRECAPTRRVPTRPRRARRSSRPAPRKIQPRGSNTRRLRASISRSSSASTRFASNTPSRRASRASLSRRASAAVASASASRAARDLAPVKLRTAGHAPDAHADARGRPSRAAAAAAAAAVSSVATAAGCAARLAGGFRGGAFRRRSAAAAVERFGRRIQGGRNVPTRRRGVWPSG